MKPIENTEDEIPVLEARAEAYSRQGNSYDLQNAPEKAEREYRLALAVYESLLQRTGNSVYAHAAQEICTSLADLCMQQGNLHGADVYYVKTMDYRKHPNF